MLTLDELFYKEFTTSMRARSSTKPLDIKSIGIPASVLKSSRVEKADLVIVRGINDKHYSGLNTTEAILWTRPKLKRRKFNSRGEFIVDAGGNVLSEDIALPHGSVALISDTKLGVPLKYNSNESFSYVDYVRSEKSGETKYIYIVPKRYCYKLNQNALVLSARSLRSYYEGVMLYLQNGHPIYMYTVPYNPVGSEKSYRVLLTKTSMDFKGEIDAILKAWEKYGVIFDRRLTTLSEPIKGTLNCGFKVLNPALDEYYRFNADKSLEDVASEYSDIV